MTTIELMYNPYTREKKVLKGNCEEPKIVLSELCAADGKELSEWASDFLKSAVNYYNDSLTINFSGIRRDYEFLQDAKEKLEKQHDCSGNIILKEAKVVEPGNRLEKLKALFSKMQKETPFSSLKEPGVQRLFEKATDSEFEMAVVATMSSGKSTLINSILGKELLPALNEATTANIARIHDIDDADHFTAVSFDKEGNKIDSADPLTLEKMEQLNNIEVENPASVIEIYGNIPGIKSENLRLVLTDTPGTNNSRTAEHEKHTMDLLNADYKPMIIYILNSQQLEVNDDSYLLSKVAKLVKSGDRQSRDRFLFVLNKADVVDSGKNESVAKMIDKAKSYLSDKHKIDNPRIFPTAARLAKLIRQAQSNDPLTTKEKFALHGESGIESFIEDERMHFTDYAKFLSHETYSELNQRIEEAKKSNNKEELALLYSGVPSIELAISEYLSKYALPAKITEGVYSFKDKIEALNIEANAKKELAGNEQKVQEMQENLKTLKNVLDKGDKAKEVRKQIKDLSVEDKLKNELAKSGANLLMNFSKNVESMKEKVHVETAKAYVNNLKLTIPKITSSFNSSVERSIDNLLRAEAKECVDNYTKYVEALIGSVSYNMPPAAILGDKATITVDEAIDEYAYEEDVYKGSHREKKSGFGWRFVRFITFGKCGYEYVSEYERQKFVDFNKYIDNTLSPEITKYEYETRKTVTEWAKGQETKFKQFFLNKLSELDEAIKKKIAEQEAILKDKEKMEKMIAENKNNLVWLDSFRKQLDGILSI